MMMKGLFNIVLMFTLILLFTLTVAYIMLSFTTRDTARIEVSLNNDAYMMEDSLDIAKLFVEDSLRYSVIQAMYDNGMRGGFSEIPEANLFERDGKNYTLWYSGTDISPGEELVLEELKKEAHGDFGEYVKTGTVIAIFPVVLPEYDSIDIANTNNYTVSVSMQSESPFSIGRVTDDGSDIKVSRPSSIALGIDAAYFRAFTMAKERSKKVSGLLGECDSALIEKTEDTPCCRIESEILEDSDGSCIVKVEASTKKSFLLWNGKESLLDNIRLVFVMRSGVDDGETSEVEPDG